MTRTRLEAEAEEERLLAPYAQKSSLSAGRKYKEQSHPFRTAFERDRARVIHSRAFRRLEYKTQVFLNGTGDHLRTRLTHTIEVASISRTIARSLRLNEDLAEAIALAHDLGHAPFGHSGEQVLDQLMSDHGGFEHNTQSLRIVQDLEQKYPRFAGLNLSYEVLEGLQKRHTLPAEKANSSSPTLEAQVADVADEITYYSHDIDDGIDSSLIGLDQLSRLAVWHDTEAWVRKHFRKKRGCDLNAYIIRCIIDRQVQDVIETSAAAIGQSGVTSVAEVRKQKQPLIRYSKDLFHANKQLRKFLFDSLYHHPKVAEVNKNAAAMIKNIFGTYVQCPKLLGSTAAKRIKKEGLHRSVCDYLSGMTDRYLLEEHERLFLQEGMVRAMRVGPQQGMRRVFE